MIISNTICC